MLQYHWMMIKQRFNAAVGRDSADLNNSHNNASYLKKKQQYVLCAKHLSDSY